MKKLIKKLLRENIEKPGINDEITKVDEPGVNNDESNDDEPGNDEPEKITIDPKKLKIIRKIVNGKLSFLPYHNGLPMGGFRLVPFKHDGKDDVKIQSVSLHKPYRKQGFGVKMYRYIFQQMAKENKKVYSDDKQSQDAQNVWNSLIRRGFAKKTDNGFVSNI